MSGVTRIPVDQEGLAKLHAALEPAATYAALVELVTDRFGQAPRGAYVATSPDHYVLDNQCPTVGEVPDHLAAERYVEGAAALQYHFRGKALGLILFDGSIAAHHQEVTDLLDEHFAPALFRASYLSQTLADHRRANEQLYYLTEISKLLGELDVEMLLVNILELTSGFLGADVGSITLRENGDYRTAVDWGLPHQALLNVSLKDGAAVLDHAVENRKPLFLTQDDLSTHGDGHRFERLLVLPLGTSNEVLGTINLVAAAESIQFGPERLEIVRPGVGLAAMALENALLVQIKLEREREQEQMALGQQIQQGLLPQVAPSYQGLDVAGHSVAAKMIGGDYFDYFTLPDGAPGLVVADVAGKGVPAGLIMTAARAMFRGAVAKLINPVEILEHVNALMCAEDFGGRFVTAIFARVDLEAGKVQISAAGHEPAILQHADGSVEHIEIRALPMGLRETPGYETVERDIGSGDILLLHTDGVNEAMDADRNQFGADRVEALIAEHSTRSAQEILDVVVRAVDDYITGVPRHDDTTLIVSRIL